MVTRMSLPAIPTLEPIPKDIPARVRMRNAVMKEYTVNVAPYQPSFASVAQSARAGLKLGAMTAITMGAFQLVTGIAPNASLYISVPTAIAAAIGVADELAGQDLYYQEAALQEAKETLSAARAWQPQLVDKIKQFREQADKKLFPPEEEQMSFLNTMGLPEDTTAEVQRLNKALHEAGQAQQQLERQLAELGYKTPEQFDGLLQAVTNQDRASFCDTSGDKATLEKAFDLAVQYIQAGEEQRPVQDEIKEELKQKWLEVFNYVENYSIYKVQQLARDVELLGPLPQD